MITITRKLQQQFKLIKQSHQTQITEELAKDAKRSDYSSSVINKIKVQSNTALSRPTVYDIRNQIDISKWKIWKMKHRTATVYSVCATLSQQFIFLKNTVQQHDNSDHLTINSQTCYIREQIKDVNNVGSIDRSE